MAVLIISDASDDTIDHYDEVINQLEATGQGHPPGRQFHVAARKGDGYLVVDVWESQEALDRFAQTLLPLLEQTGTPTFQPQVYPVHNTIKGA